MRIPNVLLRNSKPLATIKTLMIPSDYEMLKRWLTMKETMYVESVIENQDDRYLKKFKCQ